MGVSSSCGVYDSNMGASTPTLAYNSPPMGSALPILDFGHLQSERKCARFNSRLVQEQTSAKNEHE